MHRAFWHLSCDDCERWMHVDGVVTRRAGLPVARPKGTVTPCYKCPKVPAEAPARSRYHAVEPSPRTRAALGHYLECRAVGAWPDDPICRRTARIIREVADAIEAGRQESAATSLGTVAEILAGLLKR